MRCTSFTTLFVFATLVASSARAEDPQIGKTPRYCNPLPMVTAPGGNASGDVTVIREQGKYYMYCTGGGAWISDDLLHWSFYLEYSGAGTQWKTYATGYYTAKSPLGPFTYASNNPLLRRTDGLVTGTGHGSIVEGPDKNLWQFYTIVLSNPPGGRRIGMDRITCDKDGRMAVGVTDTPQWAPGAVNDPTQGDSGSIPLTINKVRAMNAFSRFSSQQPGRDAAYAVDNSSGTWWEPATTDTQPTLTIELSPATRFDAVQLFTIDSVRLMFNAGRGRGGRGVGGTLAAGPAAGESTPATAAAQAPPQTNAYQYKIEVSLDGQTYTTALDQRKNAIARNTIFEEIPPVKCRFVRLTMANWPRATPLGIIEFTVFGKPAESLPAAQPIPGEFPVKQ